MEIYLQNYWLLYLDFLFRFRRIKYKGIPLSLLPNFYQYLDNGAKTVMGEACFKKSLYHKQVNENQLHMYFEKYVSAVEIEIPQEKKKGIGRVLYNTTIPLVSKPPKKEMERCKKEFEDIFQMSEENPVFSSDFFRTKIYEGFDNMMDAIESYDEYLKTHGDNIRALVITTAESLRWRSLVLVAKKYGIPTFVLQHGALMGAEAFFPLFTDYAAVYGNFERDWYEKKGVEKERVTITGYSKFDRIFHEPIMPKELVCRQLGLCPSKSIVLIPTQPLMEETFIKLVEELAANTHLQVVIKPHPIEINRKGIQEYVRLSIELSNVMVITQGDIYRLLPHVDVAVILESTLGLEAMLFGVPVVSYKYSFEREYKYYDALKQFRESNFEIAVHKVFRILSDPVYRMEAQNMLVSFLQYAYPLRLSRLSDFIEEVT